MKLELEICSTLCETEIFIINNIEADSEDFGIGQDERPHKAEDYGCGDRVFTGKTSTLNILDKYNINQDEFDEIVEKLENTLSFGQCGWCV